MKTTNIVTQYHIQKMAETSAYINTNRRTTTVWRGGNGATLEIGAGRRGRGCSGPDVMRRGGHLRRDVDFLKKIR